jgi:hypothetical protein
VPSNASMSPADRFSPRLQTKLLLAFPDCLVAPGGQKGGVFEPLVHLLKVVLAMPGSRLKTREIQAVQQVIDARKRIMNSELFGYDSHRVFGPQTANAIRLGRSGKEPFFEPASMVSRQFRGATGRRFGANRVYAAVTIGIYPALDEVLASAQYAHDAFGELTIQSQQHGSITVALLGVDFFLDSYEQLLAVFGSM